MQACCVLTPGGPAPSCADEGFRAPIVGMNAPTHPSRDALAQLIALKLSADLERLRAEYSASGTIRHAVIDDLLPPEVAQAIFDAFPPLSEMVRHVSLRESKSIAVQMNRYHPLTEEAIYAFQDPSVVSLIGDITGLQALEPDSYLYAGGLSAMQKGDYLNPHIDNSHDKDRRRWRVLNLLYYVTPSWDEAAGGSLELWPQGLDQAPLVIPSRQNRLVIMETHEASWHSVNPLRAEGTRTCVSNYYFSRHPAREQDRFHVTFFRGRPENRLQDLALRLDGYARTGLRKLFRQGVRENPHVYKR